MFATFHPLETIHESRSAPESPSPEPTSLEAFLQALSKQTDIMNKPTTAPSDNDGPSLTRTRSTSTPKLRNPGQRVREWIKRSNSTRSLKDDPPSPILEIAHLGGGRVGDDEIAQMHAAAGITAAAAALTPQAPPPSSSNSTNPRPPPPRAEARVTQWIDLYPECLETVVEVPSPEWQPQELARPRTAPGPGKTKAINAFPVELDGTSATGGLRPPPLKMTTRKPESKTGVPVAVARRKPSREEMGRLPRLDTTSAGGGSSAAVGGSPTARTKAPAPASAGTKPTTTPSPSTTTSPTITTTTTSKDKARPEPNQPSHSRTPSSPTKWKTKPLPSIPTPPATAPASVRTVSSTADDLALLAPPTPDSEAGGTAARVTFPKTKPAAASSLDSATTPKGIEVWSSPPPLDRDGPPVTTTTITTTGANPPPGPPKYTRHELIWLHRNYRGELPFLRAWGLDISSAEDRAEGLEMLRELMLEEEEMGGGRGGHERSGSKGSLAGSTTGEIEVGFHRGEDRFEV